MKTLHVNSWSLYEQALDTAYPRVAFDIGANDGGYSKTMLEHGFEVHAFEPVPWMFQKMAYNIGINPKFFPVEMGLSNDAEIIRGVQVLEAWTLGKPGLGGLQESPDHRGKMFDLHLTTLDHYCQTNGIEAIGLIKLDVDGYEYRVLKGAREMILKSRPPILCELGQYLEKIGDDPRDFIQYIFDLGYAIMPMDGSSIFRHWHEVEPQYPHNTTFDVMLIPMFEAKV